MSRKYDAAVAQISNDLTNSLSRSAFNDSAGEALERRRKGQVATDVVWNPETKKMQIVYGDVPHAFYNHST